MNIAYITQLTNLDITNRNPLEYIKDYDKPEFEVIMPSHLLPKQILDWARADTMPDNAIDLFIEIRVGLVLDLLKTKLNGLTVEEVDTGQVNESATATETSDATTE